MKKQIEAFITSREALKKELITFCKNESIPLEERWELFVKSDLGEISRWTSSCKVIDDILQNENECEYDKYSTNFYDKIIKKKGWMLDDPRTIEVKKYALSNFEKGFVHDW